jgi:hypothetical protein
MNVSNKSFSKKTLNNKCITKRTYQLLIHKISNGWKTEGGCFEALFERFVPNITHKVQTVIDTTKSLLTSLTSTSLKLIFFDVLVFITNLRDGCVTLTKLITSITTIITLGMRISDNFRIAEGTVVEGAQFQPEMLDGFPLSGADIFLGLSLILPKSIVDPLKSFYSLSGKRITDCDLLMNTITSLFSLFLKTFEYLINTFSWCSLFKPLLLLFKNLASYFIAHNKIKEIVTLYTRYVTDQQVMFDPIYREKVLSVYSNCSSDEFFMAYVNNSDNKHFKISWNAFKENVVKFARTFDISGRDEPICLVFEGAAGSGKSVLMNAFVDYLRVSRSVYIHTVPSVDCGKDFYDDYENQEVFVMDDVGQQGISQWRTIINYVSPVKFPLECATASKKNTKFFNSKIILCTTNHFKSLHNFTKTDCISEPAALFRRIHLISCAKTTDSLFRQTLQYSKYAYLDGNVWLNKFLYQNSKIILPTKVNKGTMNIDRTQFTEMKFEQPTTISKVASLYSVSIKDLLIINPGVTKFQTVSSLNVFNDSDSLLWLARLLKALEESELENRRGLTLSNQQNLELRSALDDDSEKENIVLETSEEFVDAVSEPLLQSELITSPESLFSEMYNKVRMLPWESLINGVELFQEWIGWTLTSISNLTSNVLDTFFGLILTPNGQELNIISKIFLYIVCYGIASWLISYLKQTISPPTCAESREWKKCTQRLNDDTQKYLSEGGVNVAIPKIVEDLSRFSRLFVNRVTNEMTHGIVSGKFILLPGHVHFNKARVDVYQTWDHKDQGCKELEEVELLMVETFLLQDLAVYVFADNSLPLYKKCNPLFNSANTTNDPTCFYVGTNNIVAGMKGLNFKRNSEEIKYIGGGYNINHPINSGFMYPVSSRGLCGSFMADTTGTIIGFHIAGNGDLGFMMEPPMFVKEKIREIMLSGIEAEFEIDGKIIKGLSGVRLRYFDGAIKKVYPIVKTNFVKSPLHRDFNPVTNKILDEIAYIEGDIQSKGPPIITQPIAKLQETALKTFKHQGTVLDSELLFISDYLNTIMVPFSDISDHETAFGNEYLPHLNKDAGNGYGLEKDRTFYFDYENKVITEQGKEYLNNYKNKIMTDTMTITDNLCVETFKDELRLETKRESPRTFRIMPMGHIFYGKKIFGQLMKHFKLTKHETGLGIGFNPYKDFDILAQKLQGCRTLCDIDFSKWDGSLHVSIMRTIHHVFKKFYTGYNTKILDTICETTYNSNILVYDALYKTTHGLPSGIWLTLLYNCLYNKCLTALVVYRNGGALQDVHEVVDYVTGDDKICGTNGKYLNALLIAETANALGMATTNGDKTPIERPTQDFSKLVYLKRKFVKPKHKNKYPFGEKYMGALDMVTILNTIQWMDKSKDLVISMEGKVKSMQIESYLHGELFYAQFLKIIKEGAPEIPLFTEDRIVEILLSDDGYNYVNSLSGKDISWNI